MGQEDSRPSNESTMSSATPPVLSHTDHENAARQDEGLLTPATVLTARATLSKNTVKGGENSSEKRVKAFESSRNSRRSLLLSCRDCRFFKTTSRFCLKRHVKRAHPFSVSALPPLFNKRKRNSHPLKKSGSIAAQKAPHQIGSEGARKEWYIPSSGRRMQYLHCAYCDYRTETRTKLIQHERAKHPSPIYTVIPGKPPRESRAASTNHPNPNQEPSGEEDLLIDSSVNKSVMNRHVNQPDKKSSSQIEVMSSHNNEMPPQKKSNNNLLKCLECDFSTPVKTNMNAHKKMHQNNGKYKCDFCSYSSDLLHCTTLHFKHGHHRSLKLPETPAPIKEGPLEAGQRKQFVVTPENTEQLPPNQGANHVPIPGNVVELPPTNEEADKKESGDEGQQEGNVKIQLLQSRLKVMEERARIINEEMKEISSKKMDVQKKIDEIEGKRASIECNLRSEQSDLREMIISALKSGEEPSEILKQSLEEEIKCLEDEIKLTDVELQALKEEGKSLDQNLEDARSSHFGVVQVLLAMQSELDGLLPNICV